MSTTYPSTAHERQQARDRLAGAVLVNAMREARKAGRSIKCGNPQEPSHAGSGPNGCKNDGSTCVCECHDAPVEPRWSPR